MKSEEFILNEFYCTADSTGASETSWNFFANRNVVDSKTQLSYA